MTLDGTADENGESSAWTAEWKDLPKYDENGEKITYSVYESEGQEGFIGDHTSESSALTFEGSSAAITNKKIGGAKVSLGASKVMTGAPLSGGDFSFELSDKDGSVIDTKSNDANGNISFVDIDYTYNDVGDHVYYIKEVPGSDSSIKYDSSIYRVTVSVRADGTNVTAEPKYEKSTDGGQTWSPVTKAIFSNIKGSAAKWNLVAKKVTSDNSKFEAGEFLFGIFDESGHQYYLTSEGTLTLEKNGNTAMTATNDASGNIVFPEVTAASESETSYYIKEIGCASDDSADKWICDTISAHKADVRVYKDSDGNFKAEVKYAQNVNQTTGPKFTNSRKNVSLKIKKVWSGITTANRPDSVSFEILRKTGENDYEPFGRTVTINKPAYDLSDTWTEVAEDLPAVDGNGNEYSYSVREVGSEGNHFESTVTAEADSVENGTAVKNVKVTNKPDSEKIVIPVRKNWAEGVSGNSVTVILLRDKQQVDSAVLKAGSDEESNWKHTFSNLPRFASDGHEYDYKVIEANDNYKADILADGNGGFIITNDQSDKKVSIPVEKKWADGVSGESATIILKQDDRKIGSIDLKESNSWKHTFKDLDKYAKDGHEYKYTVEETNNNYNTIIARNDVTDIEKGFTVRNYQSEEKVSIPVEKKWAEGVSGEEAVIVLVVNGEETDQKLVLTETDHWKGSFDNLDKYGKDGKEIEYSVTEETSEFQYTVEKDGNGGFIVTNYKEETPVTPPDDNPSSPNSPDSPDKGNGGSNSAVTVDSTAPLTGDNFDMSLFVLTAGGAALAIAITLAAARRRRRD